MGSWNQTCAVSNLPIMGWDTVRVIFLRSNGLVGGSGGGSCYTTDMFQPISLPLKAMYDDYGRAENWDNSIQTTLFLDHMIRDEYYIKTRKDKNSEWEYKKLLCTTMDELIETVQDGNVVYKHRYYTGDREEEVAYMMVLESMYQMFVREVGKRKTYSNREDLRTQHWKYFTNWKEEYIKDRKERDERIERIKNSPGLSESDRADLIQFWSQDRYYSDNWWNRFFGEERNHLAVPYLMHYMKLHVEDSDHSLHLDCLDFLMFDLGMTITRKMYIHQCGQGSQISEYDLQHQIGLEIGRIIKAKKKEAKEEKYEFNPKDRYL